MDFLKTHEVGCPNLWSWLDNHLRSSEAFWFLQEKAQHPEPEVTLEDRHGMWKGEVGNP